EPCADAFRDGAVHAVRVALGHGRLDLLVPVLAPYDDPDRFSGHCLFLLALYVLSRIVSLKNRWATICGRVHRAGSVLERATRVGGSRRCSGVSGCSMTRRTSAAAIAAESCRTEVMPTVPNEVRGVSS